MYTVKEVASKMQVSEHTLRFWDKSGFFPFVTRDRNNVRNFSDDDLLWIYIVKCLKSTGADNKSIKKYIDLCLIGNSTIKERYEIIRSVKLKAEQKLAEIIQQIEVLNKKETYYKEMSQNPGIDQLHPDNLKEKLDAFLKQHLSID